MDISFVEEKKINGDIIYYTTIDDVFTAGSLSHNKDKAYEYYNNILNNKKSTPTIKILQTVKIN
jgi:hypothetical protein